MKREFRIQLCELKRNENGSVYSGDPIVYATRSTKKAAIAFIKKGVQRADVLSGWIDEDTERDNPYRAFIYKGDSEITDHTDC